MIIYRSDLRKLLNLGSLGPEGDCIIKIEEDKYADFLIFCTPGGSKDFI